MIVLEEVVARFPRVQIVIVSGSQDQGLEQAVRDRGAADLLHKPVDPKELRKALARALARSEGGGKVG